MITPIFPSNQAYYLPRPDRLYQQIAFRRSSARMDRELTRSILADFGLEPRGPFTRPGGPGRSDSVICGTNAGRKLVKRYKETVEPAAVIHEHSLLRYLAEVGFPAPRLISTPRGDTLIQRAGQCYAVFDYLEGYFQYHNYVLLPAQARRFVAISGRALGALHMVLEHIVPAGRHLNGFVSHEGPRWRELDWFTDKLAQCRRDAPGLRGPAADALRRALAADASWVEERLCMLDEQLKAAAPPRLIIHGDYGPYNLLFRRAAPVVIVDFELARLDWRLTDLATALPSFARNRFGFRFATMRCFLAAYRSSCPIDPAELALLPEVWQFLSLRRVIVGWQRCCETGAARWLDEARQKLELARWLDAERRSLNAWLAQI